MNYYQESVALGSKTGLSLVSKALPGQIDKIFSELWKTIFLFERSFSRFLPASELSMFNRNAGTKQNISPEFRNLLTKAKNLAEETSGLYNPFILPALHAAGYINSRVPGYEDDKVDDYAGRSVAGIERLEIGDDWARIPYGTALDLGGCGKGYLADKLKHQIGDAISGYWLSLGGDIVAGGHDEHDKNWTVLVQSALDTDENVAKIIVKKPGAIATSGITVHRGEKKKKHWHHLIDPRTLEPAKTDILLATVSDDSAARADVLASCAVILGSKQGLRFLKEQGVKTALLQRRAAKGGTELIHFGNSIIIDTAYA